MEQKYRQCNNCILDTNDDPNITFNEEGVCNYCTNYKVLAKREILKGEEGRKKVEEIIFNIKTAGKGKQYDSIIGVSGGVDSTYLALQAKKMGLRPLLVHFDNGWDSELAVMNIENIINKLGFDLYTYVIDWDEFKDLQLAYLKASVVDIEAITDHAIAGTLYKIANKYKIKHIISGYNIETEGILPPNWVAKKEDAYNILSIYKKFGTKKLRSFPLFSRFQLFFYYKISGIRSVNLLNFLSYNKDQAKKEIIEELHWRDYGGKHYESIFTRFYQGFILPTKFHIDKRKAHLSNLICSGQITREQALEELKKPIYNEELLKRDKEFVLKKLGLTSDEFDRLMKLPVHSHEEYGYNKPLSEEFPLLSKILKFFLKFI